MSIERHQISRLLPDRLRAGGNQVGRNEDALIILDDSHDHHALAIADGSLAGSLHVELGTTLEYLVGHAVETGSKVRSEVRRRPWPDHIHVTEADPLDHA